MRALLLLLVLLLPAVLHAQAPPLTLISPNSELNGHFGEAVSGVPDVDGDGHGDLLVGAPLEGGGATLAGRAYLLSGATGSTLLTLASPNFERFGNFGRAVSGVPDADGDEVPDLVVGAPYEDGGAVYVGRAYLFSGATGALLHTLNSPNPEEQGAFGGSVSGMPDMDGDGHGDLLLSAYRESGGGVAQSGRAYLFSGATGALLRNLLPPNPERYGDFGCRVSRVPDADADGRDDLLIGARAEDVRNARQAGRAYVFSGATATLLHTLTSSDPEFEGFFGVSTSGVPDVDGDGRGDLLVGADNEEQAYLFSGATGTLLRALGNPNSGSNGGLPDSFSWSLSGVPDTDGDGRGDLLVGAYGEDIGALDAGRAYLFLSGSGLTVTTSGSPNTVPPGGAVTVTATVTNTTAQPASLDLWVVAEQDGNPVLTRLIGSGTLPADATVTRTFSLTAPGNTPPGPYTVNVNVGDFPDTALATDAFDVTVTGERVAGISAAEPFGLSPLSGNVFSADVPASSWAFSPSVVASPNPFAGQTTLRFALTEASTVRLSVYDVLGREVAVLVHGEAAAGAHTAVFDGRGLASGVYVWRLAADGAVQTGRLTLLE